MDGRRTSNRWETKAAREADRGSFSAEFEPDLEPCPRRRSLSLPYNFAGTRNYHVHEHHYYMWDNNYHEPGPMNMWQPPGRHPWNMRRWNNGCPSCSSRGAWAPPWVFEEFPLSKSAGRFSLAGGLIFLVLMALCRGGRAIMQHIAKHARPALPPAAE